MNENFREYLVNGFSVRVAVAWDSPEFLQILQKISPENLQGVSILQDGRHRVYRAKMPHKNKIRDVVVKTYGKQSFLRCYLSAKSGKSSKATRAFETATHLRQKGIDTPEPIAVVERKKGFRLLESHFICEYVPALSDLRKELNLQLCKIRDCESLMELLVPVAKAIRKFHDSGVIHRDLGNQNIGLQKKSDGSWSVYFIDLDRSRIFSKLTDEQRGRDLSRLEIPSGIFNEFLCVYGAIKACRAAEKKARTLFNIHSFLRPFRHPLREAKLRKIDGQNLFFNFSNQRNFRRNIWIWDERSAQAIPAFNSKDRRALRPVGNVTSAVFQWLLHGFAIRRTFCKISGNTFSAPCTFDKAIGMSLEADPKTWDAQIKWLNELQGSNYLPILIRIYHHKGKNHRTWAIEKAAELHAYGNTVAFALVQDREAVLRPQSWENMLEHVITETHHFADFYEIGHVSNRGKWGIWGFREYRTLLQPALALKEKFPKIRLSAPACIDFDLHSLPAILGKIPTKRLDYLSQHLYVDRRGAPENEQNRFDLADKCALHRAFARVYKFKEERIIISEVNWPLLKTGPWSPVGLLFPNAGPWESPPSVSEDDYAKFMCRYLLLAIASGHVARVYWWRLAARGYGLIDDTGTLGDWRARPAFYALQKLLALLTGTRFERKIPGLPEGVYALEFSRADGSRFMLRWDADSLPEQREIPTETN